MLTPQMPQIILPVFRLHGMLSMLYVFGRCNTVECAYVSIYTTTGSINPFFSTLDIDTRLEMMRLLKGSNQYPFLYNGRNFIAVPVFLPSFFFFFFSSYGAKESPSNNGVHDVVVVAVRQKVVACRQSSVLERKGFPPSVPVRSGVSYDRRGDIRRGRLVGALHKQRKSPVVGLLRMVYCY